MFFFVILLVYFGHVDVAAATTATIACNGVRVCASRSARSMNARGVGCFFCLFCCRPIGGGGRGRRGKGGGNLFLIERVCFLDLVECCDNLLARAPWTVDVFPLYSSPPSAPLLVVRQPDVRSALTTPPVWSTVWSPTVIVLEKW